MVLSTPPTPTLRDPMTDNDKYRARDTHEAFFRPKLTTKLNVKSNSKTKSKPRDLTDRELVKWAREYYEQHHGLNYP